MYGKVVEEIPNDAPDPLETKLSPLPSLMQI